MNFCPWINWNLFFAHYLRCGAVTLWRYLLTFLNGLFLLLSNDWTFTPIMFFAISQYNHPVLWSRIFCHFGLACCWEIWQRLEETWRENWRLRIAHYKLYCRERSWPFRKLRATPHNSKCRYGERGAADAKPKAQIILDVLSSILATQMPCRSCRSGA